MTVDVEEHFQVSAFDRVVSRDDWDSLESRVRINTHRLLDLFDEYETKATFFVLGWVAQRHPDLVLEIASRGHELASHGFGHRLVYDQSPDDFREDVRRAKDVLESIAGSPVLGYRAPSFSITSRTPWALDVLVEEGYAYDSSIFPIRHDRYGMPGAPRHAYVLRRDGGAVTELPPATIRVGSAVLPAAGGGYFRLLPYGWTRWGLGRINQREGCPAVFYVHPWELDPDQPRLPAPALGRFRHYRNLDRTEQRLRRLLQDFKFGPAGAYVGDRLQPVADPASPPVVVHQPAADPDVTVATPADRFAWDAFVAAHPDATGYHDWAWRDVFERGFGHRATFLIARAADGTVRGVLPLVEVRSLVFGRSLTSLPFVNYGGIIADSEEATRALARGAGDLGRRLGARHVELRHRARLLSDSPCRQHKVAMHLRLGSGLWKGFDRKVRNQVRKAEKSGLVAEGGGAALLPEFYAVFARNMRDLGTPVYGRRFFAEVLSAFPDRARIIVVRLEGKAIAAGLSVRSGPMVEMPWASSLREHNPLCPNHLLYWTTIRAAAEDGCSTFDFGRSSPGGGTYRFKAQWGAEPVPLYWEYPLLAGEGLPDQSPDNPRFRLAIAAWQRLPLWVTNALGPSVARGLP